VADPGSEGVRTTVLDAKQIICTLPVGIAVALSLIAWLLLRAAVPREFLPRGGIARGLRPVRQRRLAFRGPALLQLLHQSILRAVVAAEFGGKAELFSFLSALGATGHSRTVTPGAPACQEAIHSVGTCNTDILAHPVVSVTHQPMEAVIIRITITLSLPALSTLTVLVVEQMSAHVGCRLAAVRGAFAKSSWESLGAIVVPTHQVARTVVVGVAIALSFKAGTSRCATVPGEL